MAVDDDLEMPFGKYYGELVKEVDAFYRRWLLEEPQRDWLEMTHPDILDALLEMERISLLRHAPRQKRPSAPWPAALRRKHGR